MDILAKNLLILASAGSGKTFQLGNRVIGLIAAGAEPERIVALTFTRKAAGEFADSVLTKLAEAAADETAAARLRETLAMPGADFKSTLASLVRALPLITLGTMDSFFARIVRSFQYELGLTGGRFELLEGARATALADEMLAGILGDLLSREDGEQFYHAFRRATIGRENQTVVKSLRDFVSRWHGRFRESPDLEWGPPSMATVSPDAWAMRKSELAAAVLAGLDQIEFTRKGQREALEKEITTLEHHTIGSGSLGSRNSSLMTSILDAVATRSGPLIVKSYKEFTIGGTAGAALREMVELAAHCEFSSALLRTRAVRDVVSAFDLLCARQLRAKGLLGFNDVKLLMGDWVASEDARLRREAVDFRLDARIDHWLLDEFQDTSRADWNGLLPLVDEAASDADSTMFIVGDRKQAIYAWRGGEVGLFDEVISRYGNGLKIETMAESWRSCPEVLALVNRICGDHPTLGQLFGEVSEQWVWQNHIPAPPLSHPEKRGQARVEIVGDWDQRLTRLAEILHELDIGKRDMTCGILLRGNEKVRQVADDLRARGFDVIEEGRRVPGKDNPVGILITNLLNWIADPADRFARGVVEMSPLSEVLLSTHGPTWRSVWTALTSQISLSGFSPTISRLLAELWNEWSDFGRRRAGDLLAGLAALDHQGGVSASEAAHWMERLELSQSPGVAAVQVMTIHKAKGLGFDVVILPEIPDDPVPQPQYFEIAEGPGWLTQTPPKWSRAIIPELSAAEIRWSVGQRYEAFCMLYVALTRAKRGLYVLLEPPSKSSDPHKPSLANWTTRASGETSGNETATADWITLIPTSKTTPSPDSATTPVPATPLRIHQSPARARSHTLAAHSSAGMKFGSAVHALFEHIGWIDETPPTLPDNDAGHTVAKVIRNPSLKDIFEKSGRRIDLFREQSVDSAHGRKSVFGVIDRLHLHRNPDGRVSRIEIIEFKTDAVRDPAQLTVLHSEQMEAYRQAMRTMYPDANIVCWFISVRHAAAIAL